MLLKLIKKLADRHQPTYKREQRNREQFKLAHKGLEQRGY